MDQIMNYITERALLLTIPVTKRCLYDWVQRGFLKRYGDDQYSVDEIRRVLRVNDLEEPFVILGEAAKRLGVKNSKVAYLCKKGELMFYKFSFYGNRTTRKSIHYFRQSDLDHYLSVKSQVDALKQEYKKPEPAILYTINNSKPIEEQPTSSEDLAERREFIKNNIWKK